MTKGRWAFGVLAAVGIAVSSSAASAADCVPGTETTYEALGAVGCSVGPVTFANINILGTTAGSAFLTEISVVPYIDVVGGQYGLTLQYGASTGGTGGLVDISWIYDVTANAGYLIHDAYLALVGTGIGDGSVGVTELLTPGGYTLEVVGTGTDHIEFAPVAALHAAKDQFTQSFGDGSASSSILTNAFSVIPVPGPIVGAGLPGLVLACGGLVALARRRRRRFA